MSRLKQNRRFVSAEMARPVASPQAPSSENWMEELPVAVLGLDGSGHVTLSNAAATALFASVPLVGRTLADVFGKDSPIAALAARASSSAEHLVENDVALAGPGFALGRASIAAGPVGEEGALTLVFLRSKSWATPKTNTRSAVRTLAHEVRNPLAGIRAAAQLIARHADAETRTLADLICEEVDRLRRLTDQLDPNTAFDAPHVGDFNVHEALERARQIVAAGMPKVQFVEHYDPSLPQLKGDKDQLIQALLNIVKNGAEAASENARPIVTLSTSFRSGVRVRTAASGAARSQLEIRVADNGPGVDPEIVDRLFEPFATTKSDGMGMGLSVAADIVARHDGRIEFDRAPGKTTFTVVLPIDPEAGV
jgi:two-component system nitrogen regulation sensor histidine kinase GlnL